jgi:hypothetical protein
MSFTQKRIDVTFTLAPVTDAAGKVTAQPTFAGSDTNSVTLTGFRTSVQITKAGGASQGEAQLRVYGMSLSLMNQLSTLGQTPVKIGKNEIAISAGDDNGVAVVFKGTISQAYTDLGGAPEGMFQVSAFAGLFESMLTIPPSCFRGPVSAALILQGLATQMGVSAFENNGVNVMLPETSLNGSALTQVKAVVKAANIEWILDGGTLAIWPKGGFRAGAVPLISPENGMVGYPFPSGQGLLGLKTLFNPQINFGAQVDVKSSITPANGRWTVVRIEHEIEAEMPGGQWFTTILGTPPGYGIRVT